MPGSDILHDRFRVLPGMLPPFPWAGEEHGVEYRATQRRTAVAMGRGQGTTGNAMMCRNKPSPRWDGWAWCGRCYGHRDDIKRMLATAKAWDLVDPFRLVWDHPDIGVRRECIRYGRRLEGFLDETRVAQILDDGPESWRVYLAGDRDGLAVSEDILVAAVTGLHPDAHWEATLSAVTRENPMLQAAALYRTGLGCDETSDERRQRAARARHADDLGVAVAAAQAQSTIRDAAEVVIAQLQAAPHTATRTGHALAEVHA